MCVCTLFHQTSHVSNSHEVTQVSAGEEGNTALCFLLFVLMHAMMGRSENITTATVCQVLNNCQAQLLVLPSSAFLCAYVDQNRVYYQLGFHMQGI